MKEKEALSHSGGFERELQILWHLFWKEMGVNPFYLDAGCASVTGVILIEHGRNDAGWPARLHEERHLCLLRQSFLKPSGHIVRKPSRYLECHRMPHMASWFTSLANISPNTTPTSRCVSDNLASHSWQRTEQVRPIPANSCPKYVSVSNVTVVFLSRPCVFE